MASIRLRRTIAADSAAVYDALIRQEKLSVWFAPHVITFPVAGTHAAFAFDEDLYFKVLLKEIVPDRKVVWEYDTGNLPWDHSKITFRMEKTSKEKTVLSFSHSGLKETKKLEKWKISWSSFLDKLKDLTEKRKIYA